MEDLETVLIPETTADKNEISKDEDKRMKLAMHIAEACAIEAKNGASHSLDNIYQRAAFYTGFSEEILHKIHTTNSSTTYKHFLSIMTKNCHKDICKEAYELIRSFLVNNYIYGNNVPSFKDLLEYFEIKPGFDINCLPTLLKKTGFNFVKLPNTRKEILIEQPEKLASRINYLQRIKNYRKNCSNIVYIKGMKTFGSNSMLMAVFPKQSWSNFVYCELDTKFHIQWLSECVIPCIPPHSVIVLDHEIQNNIPSMYSEKKEMINWLQNQGIPYRSYMHKSEIYNLILNFKRTSHSKLCEIENFIKYHDHEVLQLPYDMPNLSYLDILWQQYFQEPILCSINKMRILQTSVYKFATESEMILMANEEAYLREDNKMEELVDKLFTLAKYGTISDTDLNCNNEHKNLILGADFIII